MVFTLISTINLKPLLNIQKLVNINNGLNIEPNWFICIIDLPDRLTRDVHRGTGLFYNLQRQKHVLAPRPSVDLWRQHGT